jgi:hypothetical protein
LAMAREYEETKDQARYKQRAKYLVKPSIEYAEKRIANFNYAYFEYAELFDQYSDRFDVYLAK